MIAKTAAPLLCMLAFGFVAPRAHADDYPSPTDERVRISLGVTHVSSATTLQIDSRAGATGTLITGEDQFGLDKTDFEPEFDVMVRATPRQRFRFDYFTLDRSGDRTVGATPIVFRDVTFEPGDPLQTQINLRSFGIAYEYSFWRSERLELAATLGVHVTDIDMLAKVQTQARHVYQTDDQAGPVPTVGLDGTWVVSKRFYLDGRAQYLTVHLDNVSGSLGFYEFDALYRYRANVSLGLGYTDVTAHLTSQQRTQGGLFDVTSKGPTVFIRVGF